MTVSNVNITSPVSLDGENHFILKNGGKLFWT